MPKKLAIVAAGESELAAGIVAWLKENTSWSIEYLPNSIQHFDDGDTRAKLAHTIRRRETFVIQDYDIGAQMKTQLEQMVAAAKICDGRRITAIAPCWPFAREDKIAKREPAFAANCVRDIENAGAKQLVAVDLHSPQVRAMGKRQRFENLSGRKLCREFLLANGLVNEETTVIMVPDDGAIKTCGEFATNLKVPLFFLPKKRSMDETNQTSRNVLQHLDLTSLTVIVPDDILSTGGTLISAVKYAYEHGAERVIAFVTHCILAKDALQKLAGLPKNFLLLTTNSVSRAHLAKDVCQCEIFDLAPMIAEWIRRFVKGEETSSFLAENN
ncbi:MAG: ribose-phosphate diphosphokinase [bacterium]|nr:ribose-phosphate diphosphokinase [bacterium]